MPDTLPQLPTLDKGNISGHNQDMRPTRNADGTWTFTSHNGMKSQTFKTRDVANTALACGRIVWTSAR